MGVFGWSLPPGCGTLPGEEEGATSLDQYVKRLPANCNAWWLEDGEIRLSFPEREIDIGDFEWDDDLSDEDNFKQAAEFVDEYLEDHPTVPEPIHTPGPWELDTGGWPLIVNGPEVFEANVVCILETSDERGSQYTYDSKTAIANGRLIAQAPALAKALTDLCEYIRRDMYSNSAEHEPEDIPEFNAAIITLTNALKEQA